ncbi:alpha/beta hydrolase [Pseudomonas entomophila]|uniref:alpha/beta hydrolase n=1 Tax=Pseudomonas entomophila TaxID=312306 RepID=UPI0015E43695|nr:alpha/beta hydrolase [Pseudomonas entomophila]
MSSTLTPIAHALSQAARPPIRWAALGVLLASLGLVLLPARQAAAASTTPVSTQPTGANNFYASERVVIQSVTFQNQYGMRIAAKLVIPKQREGDQRSPAIVVGHPMGAVKEQSALLYAQKLAEQDFVTLAIDLPFWGESEGTPRNLVAPELYTEAFSAAVDYLGTRPFVDRERIGALGICGSGGFAISAAKIDPRLKAIATVSLYDMGTVTRQGLNQSVTPAQRNALLAQAAEQRYQEYTTGQDIFLNYLPERPTAQTDAVTREFWDFYRTSRGAVVPEGRTLEQTQNRRLSSEVRFMNFYPLVDIETISPRPLLFITGDQAHSREFSEQAYARAIEPKTLHYVKGAGHVDLYDRVDLIPWDTLNRFYRQSLK